MKNKLMILGVVILVIVGLLFSMIIFGGGKKGKNNEVNVKNIENDSITTAVDGENGDKTDGKPPKKLSKEERIFENSEPISSEDLVPVGDIIDKAYQDAMTNKDSKYRTKNGSFDSLQLSPKKIKGTKKKIAVEDASVKVMQDVSNLLELRKFFKVDLDDYLDGESDNYVGAMVYKYLGNDNEIIVPSWMDPDDFDKAFKNAMYMYLRNVDEYIDGEEFYFIGVVDEACQKRYRFDNLYFSQFLLHYDKSQNISGDMELMSIANFSGVSYVDEKVVWVAYVKDKKTGLVWVAAYNGDNELMDFSPN